MAVYSKKYLLFILSALVGIAAVIFGISQYFVSSDTPESESEYVNIVPYSKGPTSPPVVAPPLAPPPQF